MHLTHPVITADPMWNYIVLGSSAVFEGITLVLPWRKFTKANGLAHFWRKLRASKDPAFFVVIFENGAAPAGLFIAFCGVFFSHYFNLPVLDNIASILIGLVLAFFAIILIIECRSLLIGESATKEKIKAIYDIVEADADVVKLNGPLTMQMGPNELLLALDVRFKDEFTSGDLTKAVQRLEKNIEKNSLT